MTLGIQRTRTDHCPIHDCKALTAYVLDRARLGVQNERFKAVEQRARGCMHPHTYSHAHRCSDMHDYAHPRMRTFPRDYRKTAVWCLVESSFSIAAQSSEVSARPCEMYSHSPPYQPPDLDCDRAAHRFNPPHLPLGAVREKASAARA